MSTIDGDSSREEGSPKSYIACHECRRRKIRCGRELPRCTICKRTSQACEYPARMLKPGPKLGSKQCGRKRRRADRRDNDEAALSPNSNLMSEESRTAAPRTGRNASKDDDGDNPQENINGAESSREQISSNRAVDSQGSTRRDSIDIHDLSFILHPAHEASTSEENTSPCSTSDRLRDGKAMMLTRASYALGVTPDTLEKMIKLYFDNMTAINIFHEPTFEETLRNTSSVIQVHALLASILAFSARFCTPEGQDGQNYSFNGLAETAQQTSYFFDLASKFADEALRECGDEAPPLCVVQALVLIAYGQLTQGVRGKAWRSLGTCVRLAYELNLHLVDTAHPREVVDAEQRCHYEEKRRVWWAIWEMDVFASTVRRCPTAVDWSQIETLLPIEDEHWFTGRPQSSCFLELDPVRRWKALQDSGNHSPKAWFIVINSLMKDAQTISSPRGIPNPSLPAAHRLSSRSSKDQKHNAAMAEEAKEKLETLSNSVYCFTLALPPHLRYRNQYLGFDARQTGQIYSLRQHHCGIYNIHVMTQLAKLMIHHYDIFGESARESRIVRDRETKSSGSCSTRICVNSSENTAMNQYFDAADEILKIIRRSSDDHIQWINNFLSSTIWLASAVQLVHKEFGPPGTNRSLIKSKFEVLNMTYKKCVSFWDIQTAMQRNLETLESQLELFRNSAPKTADDIHQKAHRKPQKRKDLWTDGLSLSVSIPDTQNKSDVQSLNQHPPRFEDTIICSPLRPPSSSSLRSQQRPAFQNSPPSSNNFAITPATNLQLRDNHFQSHRLPQPQPQYKSQHQSQISHSYLAPPSPALSALDFMHLSSLTQKDVQQQAPHSDGEISASPSYTTDQRAFTFSGAQEGQCLGENDDPLQGRVFGMQLSGWNAELPNYFDDLLGGGGAY